MKIAIVGAGNGGLIVALHLLREHHNTDVEIEIYYDPSIPIEKVGQGSLPNFTGIVSEVLILGAIEKDGKVVLVHPSQKTENGLDIA